MNIMNTGGTSWLVYENGNGILIDTGKQPDGFNIIKRIKGLNINITLIFLTHTHYDHTGGAEAVRQAFHTPVAVSAEEMDMLQNGYTPVPNGTGRFGRTLVNTIRAVSSESRAHYRPLSEGIMEIKSSGPLTGFGFDLDVYHLGAHTNGSIGLKVGDAFFAGDVVFGIGSIVYPPFADKPDEFADAWSSILKSGSKMVYPGHGRPVTISRLEKEYSKRFK